MFTTETLRTEDISLNGRYHYQLKKIWKKTEFDELYKLEGEGDFDRGKVVKRLTPYAYFAVFDFEKVLIRL